MQFTNLTHHNSDSHTHDTHEHEGNQIPVAAAGGASSTTLAAIHASVLGKLSPPKRKRACGLGGL